MTCENKPAHRTRSLATHLLVTLGVCLALLLVPARGNASQDQIRAGLDAESRGNFLQAAEIWQRLSASGDPGAQFRLAILMAEGRGVAPNRSYARVLFEKALLGEAARRRNGLAPHPLIGAGVSQLASAPTPQKPVQRQPVSNRQVASRPAPTSAPAARAGAGYAVQLGFYPTSQNAAGAWSQLQAGFPAQLSGLRMMTGQINLSGQNLVRLMGGPLPRSNAEAICKSLLGMGQSCAVMRL